MSTRVSTLLIIQECRHQELVKRKVVHHAMKCVLNVVKTILRCPIFLLPSDQPYKIKAIFSLYNGRDNILLWTNFNNYLLLVENR